VLWDAKAQTVQLWAREHQFVNFAKKQLEAVAFEAERLLPPENRSPTMTQHSSVVHWPDAVLRYVMLSKGHKRELLREVSKVQEKCASVIAEIPFRDDADPLAAMRFTGWPEEARRVASVAQDTLKRFQAKLHKCSFLMTSCQLALLNADQLSIVKSVQERLGVFVSLCGSCQDEAPPRVNLRAVDGRLTARGAILKRSATNPAQSWEDLPPANASEGLRECALLYVEGFEEDVKQAIYEMYCAVNSAAQVCVAFPVEQYLNGADTVLALNKLRNLAMELDVIIELPDDDLEEPPVSLRVLSVAVRDATLAMQSRLCQLAESAFA
jgi:hypothetical protein